MLEAERKKVALRAAEAEEDAADAIELAPRRTRGTSPYLPGRPGRGGRGHLDALDAWKQVARWRIGAWVDEQTGDRPSRTSGAGSGGGPNARPGRQHGYGAPAGIPINSHSLGDLVDVSQPHERTYGYDTEAGDAGGVARGRPAGRLGRSAAPLPPPRRGAGGWLVLVTLGAAVALAIYSHGFRRGPSWAHLAAFGTGLLGFALPVVIVLVNI